MWILPVIKTKNIYEKENIMEDYDITLTCYQ